MTTPAKKSLATIGQDEELVAGISGQQPGGDDFGRSGNICHIGRRKRKIKMPDQSRLVEEPVLTGHLFSLEGIRRLPCQRAAGKS
jgi:hypothetical protein